MSKGSANKPGAGKGSGAAKSTSMNQAAASRIQSAGARNPKNTTAQSGFASRAQRAAAHNKAAK
jgi:hypothetical protein